MHIIDFFKEMAGSGEKKIGDLAGQQLNNHEKKKALGQLEERFREMASDGYLDEAEVAELTQQMRAQGLDADGIKAVFDQLRGSDSSARIDRDSPLMQLIETKLSNAESNVRDNEADTQFKIQMAVGEYTHGLESASKISKLIFDADMVAIRHIAG